MRDIVPLKCNIFCVSKNEKVISFNHKIFHKLNIGFYSHSGLFLYANDKLLNEQTFDDLLQKYQEEDGFVYLTYAVLVKFG